MATEGNPRLAALGPALADGLEGPAIADCSDVSRFGLRGRGSYDWLTAHGIAVPDRINLAAVDREGMLVLRLGQNDIAMSGNGSGAGGIAATVAAWNAAGGRKGYDGFRRDSWAHLVVSGAGAPDLMAELTDVDLREECLPRHAIAQTRVLNVDTIVARTDPAGFPGYELFFDLASRAYMVENLHHLARDFRIIGH